uniref:Uncharacterized protein n=1 Tax=Mycetohabitans endofungorum TaxID=417203 RepID=A0A6B9HDB8_9BURK|nr:hypothetical protein [Mycetohabitans endofungorum]
MSQLSGKRLCVFSALKGWTCSMMLFVLSHLDAHAPLGV